MMEEKKKKSLLNDYKVIILILTLTISIVAIGPWYSAEEGFHTRLKYGLDIEGGSWVQLQLNGAVVQVDAAPRDIVASILKTEYEDGINITGTNTDAFGITTVTFQTSSAVNQTRLNYLFSNADVSTRTIGSMTEVTIKDSRIGYIVSYLTFVYAAEVINPKDTIEYEIRTSTTQTELNNYMVAVNGTVIAYREGVTNETMNMTKNVLSNKLGNGLGVKDMPIRSVGNESILIDFAGVGLNEARELVESPGKFEIRIQTTGDESIHVLYGNAIESVGVVGKNPNGAYYVPFKLNEEGAKALQQAAIATGATTNWNDHYLMMILDDVVVYSAPLSPEAAIQLRSQVIYQWHAMTGNDGEAKAKQLQIHLRAGALPVNVNIIGSGQVEATLGQGFLKGAIIAAFFTMVAVALIVYNRYRRPEIVLPMIATSFSEVIMLLGLPVLAGMIISQFEQQLDLAAIAGIIAVIGTGIDHLVIITEEVVHEGKAPSGKIYAARIGKAFMIIFAAAATTVVAMSPLLFFGFGALKGFALVTISGVFIGVLIARPAYAVILKYILTKKGMINEKITE